MKKNSCQATLTLTQADKGKTVKVQRGEPFAIELDTNPSTGFDWLVHEIDPAMLRQGESEYFGGEAGLVGTPLRVVLCFTGLECGSTRLKLAYRRSWEKDIRPKKMLTFKLRITD